MQISCDEKIRIFRHSLDHCDTFPTRKITHSLSHWKFNFLLLTKTHDSTCDNFLLLFSYDQLVSRSQLHSWQPWNFTFFVSSCIHSFFHFVELFVAACALWRVTRSLNFYHIIIVWTVNPIHHLECFEAIEEDFSLVNDSITPKLETVKSFNSNSICKDRWYAISISMRFKLEFFCRTLVYLWAQLAYN